MGLLDDLLSAINTYPADNVEIDIVDFSGSDGHINVGEIWNFRVKVTNNGQLDMNNLDLHIRGSEWTIVGNVAFLPTFGSHIYSGKKDVDAHSARTFGPFYMRATQATGNGGTDNEDIVSANIHSYDAGLNHILRDHGHHASNPIDNYRRHVHPS